MNELETYKITAYIMIAIQGGIGLAMLVGIKGIIDICSQILKQMNEHQEFLDFIEELKNQNEDELD
jgi:hypothetical protein